MGARADNGATAAVAVTAGRIAPGRTRILWILAAAVILTLLTSSRIVMSLEIKGSDAPTGEILAGEALRWVLWLPVVPLVLGLELRRGFAAGRRASAITLHACGVMVVLAVQSLVMTAAGRSAGWYFALDSATSTFLIQLVHEGAATAIVYGAIIAYANVRRHMKEREARRTAHATLETRLAEERLRVLQMQLHPHFLLNALHAIGGLVRDGDRATAVETVSELGGLLRRSLRHSERSMITLDEELEFVAAYLRIHQARYGEGLRVRIRASADARLCLVPALIVQPLAENAVRHGTAQASAGGFIEIDAHCAGDRLHIRVSDDGPAPVDGEPEPGIGLRNTHARLRGTFGDDFTLTLSRAQPHGTVAMLTIPARTAEPAGV
ncbi:MAG TPA: histidine kinase [Longimicrobiales bacterium]|nr:histidine kinase [Longimicrobiales bacterium]